MENILSSKMMDNWEEHFYQDGESALFNSVTEMEACSEWIPGICAKDIRLQAIDGRPMFLEEEVRQYHLPSADLTEETALEQAACRHMNWYEIPQWTASAQLPNCMGALCPGWIKVCMLRQ